MKTLAILTALAIPTAALAQDLPKPIAEMECLVGTWKGAGTLTIGKDVAKVGFTWTCKRTSAKHGVLCNLEVTGVPGVALYEETDLFGYEPNTNTYHWFSVTNGGETHDHVAKMPTSNKVQFVYTGTQEGKPFKEVIELDFGKDKKSLAVRAETFVAGATATVFDLKAKK